MTPLITIVMPCYNTQRYVGETLRSIYAQTSDNFNLIVIDDGSTDYTRQVIRACSRATTSLRHQAATARPHGNGPENTAPSSDTRTGIYG